MTINLVRPSDLVQTPKCAIVTKFVRGRRETFRRHSNGAETEPGSRLFGWNDRRYVSTATIFDLDLEH